MQRWSVSHPGLPVLLSPKLQGFLPPPHLSHQLVRSYLNLISLLTERIKKSTFLEPHFNFFLGGGKGLPNPFDVVHLNVIQGKLSSSDHLEKDVGGTSNML